MDSQKFRGFKSFQKQNVHKLALLLVLTAFFQAGMAQTQFSLGVSAGYDQSYNQFYKMPKTNVDAFPDYNLGVNGILGINDWLRVKLELHYANIGFTRHWNIESTSPDRIDLSKVSLNNLDVSPRVDLRFLHLGNFEVFFSPGFRFEFMLGKYERSYTAAGTLMEETYITDKYNEGNAGVVGSLLFRYAISPEFSITLSPEYTYFFDPLYYQSEYDDPSKYDMQRIGVNLGVEWRF